MTWTIERVEQLRVLWANGVSAAVIGRELGTTRNAVIGKARRLYLPPHKNVSLPTVPRPPRPPGVRIYRPKRKSQPTRSQPQTSDNPVSIMDLHAHICRYPLWDKDQSGGLYCGNPTIAGSPYCQAHTDKCYTNPMAVRKAREAAAHLRSVRNPLHRRVFT